MPNFLKFNRFFPATKASWKIFTSKLQRKLPFRKLPKLNTSKPIIKKPYKSRYSKTAPPKRNSWPCLCIQGNNFKPKKKKNLAKTLVYHHHFQTKQSYPAAAVYVDQLFLDPIISESVTASVIDKKKIPPSTSTSNTDPFRVHDDDAEEEEEGIGSSEDQNSADHMWESLVLSSPQLNQVNERADQFIARFRQDMLLQERLARQL